MAENKNSSSLSVLSLVFGILSCLGIVIATVCGIFAIICVEIPMMTVFFGMFSIVGLVMPVSCGITAIVTGSVQLKREKNAMAKAGLILGIIGTALKVVMILASIALCILMFASYFSFLLLVILLAALSF